MVMIVRDEEERLGKCLASFWRGVDQLVVCDTGSTDGTVAVAEGFAELQGEPEKLVIGHFEWCDDFAAARNHAETLATCDWTWKIDADEWLVPGAARLRQLLAKQPTSVAAANLAPRAPGTPPIARRGTHRWVGRVHEERQPDPAVSVSLRIGPADCDRGVSFQPCR